MLFSVYAIEDDGVGWLSPTFDSQEAVCNFVDVVHADQNQDFSLYMVVNFDSDF